jgi:uncharacterized protein YecE (DUF72 family)
MEFGRVTPEELDLVNFALPKDRPESTKLLKARKADQAPEIFVGCAKWGRKDWVGKIYPPKTKEADFLEHYARHFKSIELNATFYKMPTKAQTSGWSKKVNDAEFKFCPKVSQGISHLRRLKNTGELVDRFLEGVSGFDKNLGPIFLSLHPGMGPKSLETIQEFLAGWPQDVDLFVELRHEEWFSDPESFKSIFDTIEAAGKGAVITDAAGRRDCVHMRLTNREAFIRFVGNGLHPSDYTRVDEWIDRIKAWSEQGIEKVYFFMHQHEEIHSPELCKYVIDEMNKKCGTKLPTYEFVK